MLLTVQFPFVDVRPFLSREDTHQVLVPSWGNLDATRQYLRGIGPIRERLPGEVEEWPGEDDYCRVSRAIRFDPSYHRPAEAHLQGLGLRRYCAFRRFVADGRFLEGSIVSRMELGFGFCLRKGGTFLPRFEDCLQCLASTLDLPITTRREGNPRVIRLVELQHFFDDLYLRGTTKLKIQPRPRTQPWWFRPCQPIALVEYARDQEFDKLPTQARRVPSLRQGEWAIDLVYLKETVAGNPLGVWLVGLPRDIPNRELLRRLRVTLLRSHAERQCMAEVFRQVRSQRLSVGSDTAATRNLQDYLKSAVTFLRRSQFNGVPQTDMLAASQEADEFAQAGERERLLAEFTRIEPRVFGSLASYVRSQPTTGNSIPQSPEASDIFLSHNSKDKKVVLELASGLMALGLRVWLDIWELIPGRSLIQAIESAMRTTRSAGVLFGPTDIGPWQRDEYDVLKYQQKQRKIPVIPVLLPGAPLQPDLPEFLQPLRWVDLRPGMTADRLRLIQAGIEGFKPGPETPLDLAQAK